MFYFYEPIYKQYLKLKRRREIRDHNFETISTTHEVVGRHDAEYKILFESFIGSDVALKNESVLGADILPGGRRAGYL